jgi:23S rRNA (cytosine1962-C5)-methyltransferase
VTVTRRGVERAHAGHLWIYRSDILDAGDSPRGVVVRVVDERQKYIGQALYSDRSEISLRILTTHEERVDREWWRKRLRAAAQRRIVTAPAAEAYRLVNSEGDLLPSLIVDVYRDVMVLQTLSQGTEELKEMFVELLVEEFEPRAVVERNDVRVRELEGLPLSAGVLHGDPGEKIVIAQDGVRFIVTPLTGQKTGSFLDQRENRLAARQYGHGKALDCFTFNGGFALYLAGSSESVIGLDVSEEAVAAARRNAELNDAKNVEFRTANVFDALREMEANGERFDTIVLDPPAFAKNRASVGAAARGYKEINLRALKLLNTGGILVTCTCSYHMHEAAFLELLGGAAGDAKRRVQLLEKRMQARDHPVLLSMPETYYLKCMILRVLE